MKSSTTLKKLYSQHPKTVAIQTRHQALEGFEYERNKADQADRKACYDAIKHLKKTAEW